MTTGAVVKKKNNFYIGMKMSSFIGQSIVNILLFFLVSSMILPFLYVLVVSFTSSTSYIPGKFYIWPKEWSVEAYQLILSGAGFLNALRSSLFITFVGTPINVTFNAGLAYMLSKKDLPGRSIINKLVMFTMLFGAGMIPNYINMTNLGLLNNLFACILPGSCGAWTVMVMKSFFQSIPDELEEAARIDGAGPLRVFGVIVLPLSRAMLATFTLFAGVSYWNVYFNAVMYIRKTQLMPLQVYLQKLVLSTNVSEVLEMSESELISKVPQEVMRMAAVIVVVAPILCVYPFLQKHFQKGMMVGAVKG